MDINPVLNLNRHPRDCDDCSLIDAENVMLSNDQSVLVTEPSITYNKTITNTIEEYYTNILSNPSLNKKYNLFDSNGKALYKVIGCIECSDELVIFTAFRLQDLIGIADADKTYFDILNNKAVIFRYKTTNDICKIAYDYRGGISIQYISENENSKIKGTFTYNVDNSLIIAIAEYYKDKNKIPLRTINLGTFEGINIEFSDVNIDSNLFSIAPEIYLPNMTNQSYIKGSSTKGWNYFFIRYKINKVDYTAWFPFGHPIYIDSIEQVNIVKYGFNQCIIATDSPDGLKEVEEKRIFPSYEPVGYVTGCSDYISNKGDVANITAKFNITFNNYTRLTKLYGEGFSYQIAVLCSSKSYTKAYTTYDIINKSDNEEFILNINNMNDTDNMQFANNNFNFYNVKNLTAYKNRLYISNYKITNIDDKSLEKYTDNIVLKCKNYKTDNDSDYLYNIGLIRISTDIKYDDDGITPTSNLESGEGANIDKQSYQFDCNSVGDISLTTFLNVSGETKITIIDGAEEENCNAKDVFIRKKNRLANASTLCISTPLNSERTDVIKIKYGNNITEINTKAYYGLTPIPYINTSHTFNERIKNTTLIPGEVYNFYIHFIDKYGQFTNGYKLHNKTTHNYKKEVRTVFKYEDLYISFPVNQNVAKNGILNTDNILFHNSISYTGELSVAISGGGSMKSFIDQYSVYSKNEYNTIKWYQITDCPLLVDISANMSQCFGYFENNNGDDLFKVPDYYTTTHNKRLIGLDITGVTIPNGYIGYFISYENFEARQIYTGLLTNSDFRINHYKTSFNSGGKKEWGERYTRSDIMFAPLNFRNTNKMHFYTSQITTGDKIKFNYSILKLRECAFPPDKYKRYWQQAPFFKYPKDCNKPIKNISNNVDYYPIPKYKLAPAGSVQDSRMGLGTCIEMDNDYNLFGEIPYVGETNDPYNGDKLPKMFIATLINSNRDIYMGKEKVLVRCSDYYYENSPQTITEHLNGRFTYDCTIIYDGHGVIFNEADGTIKGINNGLPFYPETAGFLSKDENGNRDDVEYKFGDSRFKDSSIAFKWSWDAYTPFMNYVQFGVYTDKMYESKSFKNAPDGKVFKVYSPGRYRQDTLESEASFVTGVIVEPINSIDLFENRQSDLGIFNPKTYTNVNKNTADAEQFDKRVNRSNVIKDENRSNAWRTFPAEGYKIISENKGKITNLYGVGTIFLVHTEHSLFMFDIDNTMKTEGKSIQLYQPDTFDVDYKEVLTSDLGYGGLQDSNSWIADQFGYIFYNRDSHRFFIFDAGQLGNPDEEIIEFLAKYRPDTCIFFNDKENHRLLIKMCYKNNTENDKVILSFNYDTKKFISRHSYEFEDAFNTKIDSFMLFNDGISDKFYQFIKDNNSYSIFENMPIINGKSISQYVPVYARQLPIITTFGDVYTEDGINPYFAPAKLKIIVNTNYNLVKFIEYITYKLYKINAAKNDNAFSPVEDRIVPFSGVTLRVYNDQIDTGYIDILINLEDAKNVFTNYEKPYWDLGNWNFSYLRNTRLSNVDDIVSRLYGNWFVFEFVINNDDNKVEFESLMVNLSKDKRV